jgi:hypothetical protein
VGEAHGRGIIAAKGVSGKAPRRASAILAATGEERRLREQLIHLLTEAAEIEHNLLCSYLYAAFSLKRGGNEGLTAPEAAAVARWRKSVMSVAIEEMAHLALVNNLLVFVGGSPHFNRPNLPVPPGYHPAGFTVRLTPFDSDTLEHFLFVERPAGAAMADGAKFAGNGAPPRTPPPTRITPSSEDYETIGELYEMIEHGLKALFRERGARAFAARSGARQLGPAIVKLPGLAVLGSLDDALRALQTIVEQGEGARADFADSHFARFSAMRAEWRELRSANAQFRPAHPAAHDPVMRVPPKGEKRVWITAPASRATLDLANGIYGALISVLYQLYEPAAEATRQALASCAMALMSVLTALGEMLARMASSPEHPGVNAGLTFTSPRNVGARVDAGLIAERLLELSKIHSRLVGGAGNNPLPGAVDQLARSTKG